MMDDTYPGKVDERKSKFLFVGKKWGQKCYEVINDCRWCWAE